MKRLLFYIAFLFCISGNLSAQTYMNEWIDFNKTYYKFKVGSTGLYRISQTQLNAMGIASADAAHFQLWRNGQQVPIFTSSSTGSLPANGFIEFWGQVNDGKWEKRMYLDPSYQINETVSLFTDTASYFLTVNTNPSQNKRFVTTANDLSSGLAPEPYFIHNAATYFRNGINLGFAAVVGSYVYSSAFDRGEGYTSGEFRPGTPLINTQNNLFVAASGPAARLKFSAAGRALNTRSVRVSVNGTVVTNREMNYFNSLIDESATSIPLSVLSGNTAAVQFDNVSAEVTDRIVIGMYELRYPRQFNFGGQSNFEFELPASAAGNNLLIDNFNFSGVAPVLYDVTNGLRITASIISPTQVRVVLPPSAADRKLVLVSQDAGVIKSPLTFTARNFVNYGITANQADYIIISHPQLYADAGNINQVEEYRLYRNSSTGGGYNAKIYNIQDILDQFGFGIKNNAYAIKNFLRFAHAGFTVKPKFCFIIGKGVIYTSYRSAEASATIERLNLVPTMGNPASDMMMASEEMDIVPLVPIGRLTAINGNEVKAYLDKVKQYESFYNSTSCDINDELWKKNVIHVSGANDFLGEQIRFYLNQYGDALKDTLFGANVYSLQKTGVAAIQTIASQNITRLFEQGFSLLTYFGHSSPSTLEYNLSDPSSYPSIGKYPIMLVNGCQAGNMFLPDAARLTGKYIITESWVLTPQRGSVAFIASTHLGIVNYLHVYTEEFYHQMAREGEGYGQPIGKIMANTIDTLMKAYSYNDFYVRMHTEEITLHGDPAIRFYAFPKPDLAINDAMVKIAPEFISIAGSKFNATVNLVNMGKGESDSVHIRITRTSPDGTVTVPFDQKIKRVTYADSIQLELPIDPLRDKGANKLKVEIDPDNVIDERCETNNTVTKEFFIFEDEIRPVYPYNYSIINKQNITYYASTANPLGSMRKYYFEIDTTRKFNSTLLKIDSVTSVGGVVGFKPSGINFQDNTVYYWRAGMRPDATSSILWNDFSFLYQSGAMSGFNQSHFYQHKQSDYKQIFLDTADRKFKFESEIAKLQIRTGIYPFFIENNIDIALNFVNLERYGCRYGSFQFYVLDGKTLTIKKNSLQPNGEGLLRSLSPACSGAGERAFFEYYYTDQNYRRRAMDFMDSVRDGDYVVVTNLGMNGGAYVDANTLKSDEASFGAGNSLYHKLKNAGFGLVDSFKNNIPMVFVYKKNDPSFVPVQRTGLVNEQLVEVAEFPGFFNSGKIESPWFGPAKTWKEMKWNGSDVEAQMPDNANIDIIGKTAAGIEVLIATVTAKDTTIDFINPQAFPYVKLRINNTDEVNVTPHQLQYWQLVADYVPEGAIAPNLSFKLKDTVELGEPVEFAIAFKNISETAFDSLKLKLVITDRNNVPHTIDLPKKKPLAAGDSLVVSHTFESKDFAGLNTLYLMVNADDDQPEQFLFNNFIFKNFYVKPDNYKPWLDVTFDGSHILNRDIVSSKPHILVKLKDDSRYLALSDTAGLKIKIQYPTVNGVTGPLVEYKPQSDSVRFVPADLSSGENSATIDLYPKFMQDGEYELYVSGTDKSGNKAGELEYKVAFQVINKPMISNMLNYPNPFTSSTAFVFTITGYEVPQNIRIQILTITGKVVREITKAELGPLRIGRNITEYKWDGTDQFGNKLANGVYLYRVITNSNGKSLEKFKADGDNTDQYFNKGYGKMYLMR